MAITAGIDVGTGAVKVAIMSAGDDCARDRLLGTYFERIRRREVMSVVNECYEAALKQAGLSKDQVDYVATTGEGDVIPWRTGHFYGMTTHARGALFIDPEARGAIDVGALHARAMRFNEVGRVLEYRMTSQCASGSGQFVENIARYLGVSLDEVGTLSQKGSKPERVSGICAVLAETDVINMVSRGISTPDILRGIHDSISIRLAGLVRGIKVKGVLMITGGLAADSGLVAALRDKLKDGAAAIDLRQHELSVHAGAIGAALWGAFRHAKLSKEQETANAGGGT